MNTANQQEQQSTINFIQRLSQIDFNPIKFKLVDSHEGPGWSSKEADQVINQYRRFLVLNYLYWDEGIVPTQEVDFVWHTHILDTLKYQEDCKFLFGQMLHHFPYVGLRGEADEQHLTDSFSHTQKLMRQHFKAT